MEDLQNKDKTILIIWSEIIKAFGNSFFQTVDFWDADNYALGFRKHEKLVYLSTWNFKEKFTATNEIFCFVEFELIDEVTFDTKKTIKQIDSISLNDLIKELEFFLDVRKL